jgi:exodeoxyribonuclease VII small subunit
MAKKKSVRRVKRRSEETLSFEDALSRLEKIVLQLEEGQLGLSDSLAQYELGIRYLQTCYQQLDQAEQKIELLAGLDDQGRPVAEAFDEGEQSLEEKQAKRSQRRSQRGRSPSSQGEAPPMDDSSSLF